MIFFAADIGKLCGMQDLLYPTVNIELQNASAFP